MKLRIFAVAAVFALALNFAVSSFADNSANSTKTADLVALLPASDGVVTIDVDRLLGEGLPQILASRPEWIAEMNAKLDELRSKTAVDLRSFDQVAIGVSSKRISETEMDYDAVLLARGKFPAGGIVALAKLASKGEYREEKVGGRTLYIFSIKDLAENYAEKHKAKDPDDKKNGWIDKLVKELSGELAITALNSDTLAVGSVERVRQTLDGKTRVSNEVIGLLAKDPNAIAKMGAMIPSGLSKFLPLENDEIGRNIDSIRQLSGSMDVAGGETIFKLAAKTQRAAQAQALHETIDGLAYLGKKLLPNSTRADQQLYGRLLEYSQFSVKGNELSLLLKVPQSDMDLLLAELMKKFK